MFKRKVPILIGAALVAGLVVAVNMVDTEPRAEDVLAPALRFLHAEYARRGHPLPAASFVGEIFHRGDSEAVVHAGAIGSPAIHVIHLRRAGEWTAVADLTEIALRHLEDLYKRMNVPFTSDAFEVRTHRFSGQDLLLNVTLLTMKRSHLLHLKQGVAWNVFADLADHFDRFISPAPARAAIAERLQQRVARQYGAQPQQVRFKQDMPFDVEMRWEDPEVVSVVKVPYELGGASSMYVESYTYRFDGSWERQGDGQIYESVGRPKR